MDEEVETCVLTTLLRVFGFGMTVRRCWIFQGDQQFIIMFISCRKNNNLVNVSVYSCFLSLFKSFFFLYPALSISTVSVLWTFFFCSQCCCLFVWLFVCLVVDWIASRRRRRKFKCFLLRLVWSILGYLFANMIVRDSHLQTWYILLIFSPIFCC